MNVIQRTNNVKFFIGDETRLVIEDYKEISESLFAAQYDKAFSELNVVVKHLMGNTKDNNDILTEKSVNNVFAFIGDRGTGKSSCMMSVAKILNNLSCENLTDYQGLSGYSYHVMETIDPSFFDSKVDILDIVVGKLYRKFKEELDDRGHDCSDPNHFQNRNNLFEKFQQVKECLTFYKGIELKMEDDVETLEHLSDAVELQLSIHELVKSYLEFFNNEMLVIPVDDLDLHTQCAHTMLEQMRKYLAQSNILILMSVKIEQLERALIRENISNYNALEKYENLMDKAIPFAELYLIKMIPQSHRIYMPSMEVYMDSRLSLYEEDSKGNIDHNGKKWREIPDSVFPIGTIKYAVTRAIFLKTRFLFYHTEGIKSPIVPRNLRELRHLIDLLYKMPIFKSNDKNEYNKTLFKNYFFDTWITNNLLNKDSDSVLSISRIENVSVFNKTVVRIFKEKYGKTYLARVDVIDNKNNNYHNMDISTINSNNDADVDGFEPEYIGGDNEIYYILNDENSTYNVSSADVMVLIMYLKDKVTNQEDSMFLFAIETLYSMKLYEYYDHRTEAYYINQKKIGGEDISVDYKVRRYDILDALSSYELLIGGSFVNSKYFRLMTPTTTNPVYNNDAHFRAVRSLQIKDVYTDDMKKNMADASKLKLKDSSFIDFSAHQLHILEWFALFISRKNNNVKNKGSYDADYRTQRGPYFYSAERSIDENYKVKTYSRIQTVYVDVTSIFFNILDIKRAYDRLDENLYKMACSSENSILNQLRKKTIERFHIEDCAEGKSVDVQADTENRYVLTDMQDKTKSFHCYGFGENLKKKYYVADEVDNRMLSWFSIRNVEILESFTRFLQVMATSKNNDICTYLKNISDFNMKTYDKTSNKKDYYSIDFKYLDVVEKCIEEEWDTLHVVKGLEPLFSNEKYSKVKSKVANLNVNNKQDIDLPNYQTFIDNYNEKASQFANKFANYVVDYISSQRSWKTAKNVKTIKNLLSNINLDNNCKSYLAKSLDDSGKNYFTQQNAKTTFSEGMKNYLDRIFNMKEMLVYNAFVDFMKSL